MDYKISKERLYIDLLVAYMCARQHKGTKQYVADFEKHLESNLHELCEELYQRKYQARPSTCFIVFHPKQREIFAAAFRDRVVHHLIFNYVHELFERTFIYDTYSCIKYRGTHFGIDRLQHNIRSCSLNDERDVYIMKMDIRGYFMHIDRNRLFDIARSSILKMSDHFADSKNKIRWREKIDVDFVLYLIREVIMLDPTENCHVNGSRKDWIGLPDSKSLFKSDKGKGLPIGNLTSQLFSNVYLNEFDQYMKRVVGCRYYGRYVDDFYVVSESKEWLHRIIPKAEKFLHDVLYIDINRGKTKIYHSRHGVDFLGGFIKPNRIYISNQSLRRMNRQIYLLHKKDEEKRFASINSFLGVLSHFKTFSIRREMVRKIFCNYRSFSKIEGNYKKLIKNKWIVFDDKMKSIEEFENNLS